MSDEKGLGKEEPFDSTERLTLALALAAPLAGGNRPRNGPGERGRGRLWVRKNVPILPHGTALCWGSRAVLGRCCGLWATIPGR